MKRSLEDGRGGEESELEPPRQHPALSSSVRRANGFSMHNGSVLENGSSCSSASSECNRSHVPQTLLSVSSFESSRTVSGPSAAVSLYPSVSNKATTVSSSTTDCNKTKKKVSPVAVCDEAAIDKSSVTASVLPAAKIPRTNCVYPSAAMTSTPSAPNTSQLSALREAATLSSEPVMDLKCVTVTAAIPGTTKESNEATVVPLSTSSALTDTSCNSVLSRKVHLHSGTDPLATSVAVADQHIHRKSTHTHKPEVQMVTEYCSISTSRDDSSVAANEIAKGSAQNKKKSLGHSILLSRKLSLNNPGSSSFSLPTVSETTSNALITSVSRNSMFTTGTTCAYVTSSKGSLATDGITVVTSTVKAPVSSTSLCRDRSSSVFGTPGSHSSPPSTILPASPCPTPSSVQACPSTAGSDSSTSLPASISDSPQTSLSSSSSTLTVAFTLPSSSPSQPIATTLPQESVAPARLLSTDSSSDSSDFAVGVVPVTYSSAASVREEPTMQFSSTISHGISLPISVSSTPLSSPVPTSLSVLYDPENIVLQDDISSTSALLTLRQDELVDVPVSVAQLSSETHSPSLVSPVQPLPSSSPTSMPASPVPPPSSSPQPPPSISSPPPSSPLPPPPPPPPSLPPPPPLSVAIVASPNLEPTVPSVEAEHSTTELVGSPPLQRTPVEEEQPLSERNAVAFSELTSGPTTTTVQNNERCIVVSRDEERKAKEKWILESRIVPVAGSSVGKGVLRRAGPYLLGPRIGNSPVRSIVQCLARKEHTDNFYQVKILTVRGSGEETQDDRQGKMLLHTEHSLLSLLVGQRGVIQHHGLFQDYAFGAREQSSGSVGNRGGGGVAVWTGGVVRRVCLVLDCVTPHDFSANTADLINLQVYVIARKKLPELDALTIFYNIVLVVHSLHQQNVVHRDLKLGNLVLHRTTREITITNFCLGQHLLSEEDRLRDQRGSPAYISPDVLSGKPYLGKPSDMWALGVVLFTMLYGHFPSMTHNPRSCSGR